MSLRERSYAESEALHLLAQGAGAKELRTLAQEAPSAAHALNAVAARLEGGAPVHEALKAAPGLFPAALSEVARAVGPRALPAALDRTARRRRGLDELVDEYVRPLVYPLGVAAFIASVGASFERLVAPVFHSVGVAAGLFGAARAFDLAFAVFGVGFLLSLGASAAALSQRPGRGPVLLWAARIFPGAGAAWAQLEAGMALRDVAAYLRAGAGLAEALVAAAAGTRGADLREALLTAAQKAMAGASGADALAHALPAGAADALTSGSAPLPDALDETGAWLAERALQQGRTARNAVHIVTVLAIAALAALVLFSVYGPVYRVAGGLE